LNQMTHLWVPFHLRERSRGSFLPATRAVCELSALRTFIGEGVDAISAGEGGKRASQRIIGF
jgi:hypothetical protein